MLKQVWSLIYFSVFNIQGQKRSSLSLLTLIYDKYCYRFECFKGEGQKKKNKYADQINLVW